VGKREPFGNAFRASILEEELVLCAEELGIDLSP